MKDLVVITHTEYHLLTALSILSERYTDYAEISLFICVPSGSNRYQFSFPDQIEHNIFIKRVYINGESDANDTNLDLIEDKIFNSRNTLDEVIFFNRLNFFAQYLIRKLYKSKIRVSLGPDGAAAYGSSNRISPRWTFMQFLKYNKFVFKNKKNNYGFYFPTLDYANQKEIERVYVQFPDLVNLPVDKEIVKYNLLANAISVRWSNLFFNFQIQDFLETNSNIFLFCNQPLEMLDNWNEKMLNFVHHYLPNFQIVVKTHPTTSASQLHYFNSVDYIKTIDSTLPIELFVANIEDSIVASFWSTASLFDTKKNICIWMYPLLEKYNAMYKYVKFEKKVPHIKYVDDLNQLLSFNKL